MCGFNNTKHSDGKGIVFIREENTHFDFYLLALKFKDIYLYGMMNRK